MRLHSVADAVTNSSSETYVFPRFCGAAALLRELLDSCWMSWVLFHQEEFRGWARFYRQPNDDFDAPGNSEERIAELAGRCPLWVSEGEDGVPYVYVSMTGTDSPEEFDDYMLSVLGGKRD